MKLRSFRHYLGAAVHNLFLNRLMTVASILTVASCVFIVSLFYLMVVNIDNIFAQLQEQIGLVVFIDDDVPATEMPIIWDKIVSIPNVQNAVPISPEETGMEILPELFDEGSTLFDAMMLDSPFRRAFEIDIYDIQFHDDVVDALEALAPYGIDNIRQERELANTLWNLTRVVQIISLVVIFVLALVSLVIIINTIRITVGSRQAEIGIMKYVGATDWFIRWPFVFEGIIIGLIGASVPAIICAIWYDSVIERIAGVPMLDFMYFLPGSAVLVYMVPLALLLGALIGFFGSLVSIRQYLKV